jgi:hypothetical protein
MIDREKKGVGRPIFHLLYGPEVSLLFPFI